MIDWSDKVSRRTPVCAHSGEPIPPGSTLYSALIFIGDHFERRDILEEHWHEVDRNGIASWWIHRLPPERPEGNAHTLNVEQLLRIFLDLASSRNRPQQCLAFCLALLLMRAKKLRYLGVEEGEAAQLHLLYENRSDRSAYRLIDPQMNEEEVERVQSELLDLIGY